MKRTVALLLSLTMALPLASCRLKDTMTQPPSDNQAETTTQPPQLQPPVENDGPSAEIKYYTIENLESNKVRYTVYNKNGDVVLAGTTERSVEISMLSEALLDVCIDAGTETETHQYYDVETDRLSESYSCVAATSGNLVAYVNGSINDPIADRVLVVRDIFDRNVFYKSFGLDFSPTMRNPIKSATFTAGEAELEVVYFSERPPVPFSVTLPIRRAAAEGEILSQSEIAMQMYEAALKNEIKVYETDIEKDHYLKDCKTPYGRIPLCELGTMGSVYMDVDGDSINELVIDCGDTLILRYYEGRVYVYPFTFRNLTLNTDGSYSWNYSGQNFEYGEKQLAFEGAELNPKELWRIVNDGEPDAEYYIDGKQVTQEEIRKYFEDNPKTRVEFSPLEVSWLNKISREEAIFLAKKYWESYEIEKYGYVVTLGQNSWAPSSVYVVMIKRLVSNHYSTFDEIWIDKNTGEAIVPYAPDGPETPPAEVIREDTYFKITKPSPTTFAYEIYDPKGNVLHSDTTDRQLNLSMLGDSIVVVTIGINEPTDDGITFFCDVQSGRISEAYSSLMLYTEDVVIYRKRSADGMTVVAKPLFDNEVYVEYLLENIASTPYPIRSFEFVNGMLCLEYDAAWDGRCSVVIPVWEPDGNYFADYGSIVALANELRTVMRYEADQLRFQELFGITDAQQGEWFDDLHSSLLDLYGSPELRFTEVKYAVKDLNGDGIFELILIRDYGGNYEVIAIFSTVDGKPFLLDHFWNRKNAYIGYGGLIGICGSNGADSNSRTICRIAEGGASLEVIDEFGLDGHEWVNGVAVQKYYKLENGEKVSISEEEYQELSMKYSYLHAYSNKDIALLEVVREESLARQASAKQAFLDVLYERAKVYDTATGEFFYLKDCKSPTTQTRLEEYAHRLYAYTDLDGDSVEELVIDCGDKLILRYFEGTVYLYSFTFEEMDRLKSDGSYTWYRTIEKGETSEYGESQIYFDGATLKIRALWRIVTDEKNHMEFYYLGERQTTHEALWSYVLSLPLNEIGYSYLPLPWEPKITLEEAWEIASAYWENADGEETDPYITYRIVLQADPHADIGAYHFVCVQEYHALPDGDLAGKNDIYFAHVYQCLLVDAMTGEYSLCEDFGRCEGK